MRPAELAEPLLSSSVSENVPAAPAANMKRQKWLLKALSRVGIESEEEGLIVFWLAAQAFLANSVFVIGRNIGPVIFMTACGKEALTGALFLGGASILLVSPVYGRVSKGRLVSHVNAWLTAFCVVVLLLLSPPLILANHRVHDHFFSSSPPGIQWLVNSSIAMQPSCAYAMYLMQDLLTLLLMMQSGSLAQVTLNAYTAKRLLGLIQLGCSSGAVITGLVVGPAAEAIGVELLILVQVAILLLSFVPNRMIVRYEEQLSTRIGGHRLNKRQPATAAREGRGTDSGSTRANPTPGSDWYKSPLIMSMALWIFSIIFCKTIVEYQYNVLVSASVSPTEMVGLTGYLYASAGVLSSFLNAFGTQSLLRYQGLGVVLMLSPAAELLAAVGIIVAPGVPSAFLGRMFDLVMRWSLNNSAKSLLWIATPRAQQELAKPWIEGTVKKATASIAAVAIGVTLALTGNSLPALATLSAVVAGAACVACLQMHKLYSASMWSQIQRRELPLSLDFDASLKWVAEGAEWGTEGQLAGDNSRVAAGDRRSGVAVAQLNDNVAASIVRKLIHGPPHVQLYVLRQLGNALPPSAWTTLLDGWESLSTAVQVRVLRLCADDAERVPNAHLVSILREWRQQQQWHLAGDPGEGSEHVLASAILACAERKLTSARSTITRFLESESSRVRAAAAVTLIRLGWGVGLGSISQVALAILEQMASVPLGERAERAMRMVQAPPRAPPLAISSSRTPSIQIPGGQQSPTSCAGRGMPFLSRSFSDGFGPASPGYSISPPLEANSIDLMHSWTRHNVRGQPHPLTVLEPAQAAEKLAELAAHVAKLTADWERLSEAGEDGPAMAKALQLTRLKSTLASARSAVASAKAVQASNKGSPTRGTLVQSTLPFQSSSSSSGSGNRGRHADAYQPPSLQDVGVHSDCSNAGGRANTAAMAHASAHHGEGLSAEAQAKAEEEAAEAAAGRLDKLDMASLVPDGNPASAEVAHVEPYKRGHQRATAIKALPTAVRDTIVAIEMMQKLPADMCAAVLPTSSLLTLLRHSSRHVRDAALPLIRRDLDGDPVDTVHGLVRAAVVCLQLPETAHRARKALRQLIKSDSTRIASGESDGEVGRLAIRLARADLFATLSVASERHAEPMTPGRTAPMEGPMHTRGGHVREREWRFSATSQGAPSVATAPEGMHHSSERGGGSADVQALPPSAATAGLLDFLHEATLYVPERVPNTLCPACPSQSPRTVSPPSRFVTLPRKPSLLPAGRLVADCWTTCPRPKPMPTSSSPPQRSAWTPSAFSCCSTPSSDSRPPSEGARREPGISPPPRAHDAHTLMMHMRAQCAMRSTRLSKPASWSWSAWLKFTGSLPSPPFVICTCPHRRLAAAHRAYWSGCCGSKRWSYSRVSPSCAGSPRSPCPICLRPSSGAGCCARFRWAAIHLRTKRRFTARHYPRRRATRPVSRRRRRHGRLHHLTIWAPPVPPRRVPVRCASRVPSGRCKKRRGSEHRWTDLG